MSDLTEALELLDSADDEHWTQDGLPSVDAVKGLLGRDVTRAEITAESPDLKRDVAPETTSEPVAAEGSDDPKEAYDAAQATMNDTQKALKAAKEAHEAATVEVGRSGRALAESSPAQTLSDQNAAYFAASDKRERELQAAVGKALDAVKAAADADPLAKAAIQAELGNA